MTTEKPLSEKMEEDNSQGKELVLYLLDRNRKLVFNCYPLTLKETKEDKG